MTQPTMSQLYQDHFDTLKTEEARVMFLLNLKRMGSTESLDAFRVLAARWMNDPILE